MLQKTVAGILRSLMHQMLESAPHLSACLAPKSNALMWTEKRLRTSFLQILDSAAFRRWICLFIDGLDEAESNLDDLAEF